MKARRIVFSSEEGSVERAVFASFQIELQSFVVVVVVVVVAGKGSLACSFVRSNAKLVLAEQIPFWPLSLSSPSSSAGCREFASQKERCDDFARGPACLMPRARMASRRKSLHAEVSGYSKYAVNASLEIRLLGKTTPALSLGRERDRIEGKAEDLRRAVSLPFRA